MIGWLISRGPLRRLILKLTLLSDREHSTFLSGGETRGMSWSLGKHLSVEFVRLPDDPRTFVRGWIISGDAITRTPEGLLQYLIRGDSIRGSVLQPNENEGVLVLAWWR